MHTQLLHPPLNSQRPLLSIVMPAYNEQEVIPEGYDASIPAETLGWVPWRIVPHWRSDHPEAPAAEIASSYMEQQGLAHRTLRDGQVVVINQG